MYEVYFHRSPNTSKVLIFFEELELEYRLRYVSVGEGEQFNPDFVAISPNSKVPVLCDTAPGYQQAPEYIFESNAILLYLAEKTGRFLPAGEHDKVELLQWLFWQASGQGPMCGQSAHFLLYAPESPYARDRYLRETTRLFGVLDHRLKDREFVVGTELSIADMACFPWVEKGGRSCVGLESLAGFPNLERWSEAMWERPAVRRAYDQIRQQARPAPPPEVFAQNMFRQGQPA